jgi:RsiW-degrading membrane proteinase PrsW (M82 family)
MVAVIVLSVLPIVAAWFWQRWTYGISALFFTACLAGGLLSLALAAVLQMTLPRGDMIKPVIRAALTEEGARFVTLALLFWSLRILKKERPANIAVTAGMTAGLAFAVVETIAFAASDPLVGVIRLVGADILHAACGIRVAASALAMLSGKIGRCLIWFFMATALHSIYNFMAPQGGLFTTLSVILAISSFISGLRHQEEAQDPPPPNF